MKYLWLWVFFKDIFRPNITFHFSVTREKLKYFNWKDCNTKSIFMKWIVYSKIQSTKGNRGDCGWTSGKSKCAHTHPV